LEEEPSENLGNYMDTWKMIHFNELFFREFVLPIGPYQGNDWKQQPDDKKVVRKYFSMMEL